MLKQRNVENKTDVRICGRRFSPSQRNTASVSTGLQLLQGFFEMNSLSEISSTSP